jgi:hypothetical protein
MSQSIITFKWKSTHIRDLLILDIHQRSILSQCDNLDELVTSCPRKQNNVGLTISESRS